MGMGFFVGSNIKTVDDHCGYALPWDPLQHLTGNNAAYHDIHHQSWGIKTNYSQPFFTIWDRMLGTMWKGNTALKYERTRATAAAKTAPASMNGKPVAHGSSSPNGKATGSSPSGKANGKPRQNGKAHR